LVAEADQTLRKAKAVEQDYKSKSKIAADQALQKLAADKALQKLKPVKH
jgi:hypothetical protein